MLIVLVRMCRYETRALNLVHRPLADFERPPARRGEPGGAVLPIHDEVGAPEDGGEDAQLRRVEGAAGVREGAPGAAPPLRHPRLHRRRSK